MFIAYYSSEALALAGWAREENNRIKAARIQRAADRLEERYRKQHRAEVEAPYRKPTLARILPPPRGGGAIERGK